MWQTWVESTLVRLQFPDTGYLYWMQAKWDFLRIVKRLLRQECMDAYGTVDENGVARGAALHPIHNPRDYGEMFGMVAGSFPGRLVTM